MPDNNKYVTRDNVNEQRNYAAKDVQFEAHDINEEWVGIDKKLDNDWTDVTDEAAKSQYRSAYDEHISMRNKIMGVNINERAKDFRRMDKVQDAMARLTLVLQEEMPGDSIQFALKHKAIVGWYSKLLKACKDYIDHTSSSSKEIKARIRMVKELYNYAKISRRCFSDRGSINELRKDGEGKGLLFYNVLGISLAQYRSKELSDKDVSGWNKQNNYYLKNFENADGSDKSEYYISSKVSHVTTITKCTTSMSRLSRFLGAEGLVRKTEMVAAKNSRGKRLLGMKRDVRYSENDLALEEIKALMEEDRQDAHGRKVSLTYSAEAVRRMSSLKLLGYLCGNNMDDADKSFIFSYTRKDVGDEIIYNIEGAYYDFMSKGFSDSYDGKKLKRKLDLSKLPGIDRDFAEAILTMEPEYIGVICGDLLNEKEIKAFGSRLEVMQNMILEQQESDSKMLANKVILDRKEWETETARKKLGFRMDKEDNALFKGLLGENAGIEGVVYNGKTEGAVFYDDIYYGTREKLVSARTAEEKYEILAKLKTLSAMEYYGTEGVFKTKKGNILEAVADRLFNEFLDENIIGVANEKRHEAYKLLYERFTEKAASIDAVPEEFVRADKRAQNRDAAELKNMYAAFLLVSENPRLYLNVFVSNKFTHGYSTYENKSMRGKMIALSDKRIVRMAAEYDVRKGNNPEQIEQRAFFSNAGKVVYDSVAKCEGVMEEARYNAVFARVAALMHGNYDDVLPVAHRLQPQAAPQQPEPQPVNPQPEVIQEHENPHQDEQPNIQIIEQPVIQAGPQPEVRPVSPELIAMMQDRSKRYYEDKIDQQEKKAAIKLFNANKLKEEKREKKLREQRERDSRELKENVKSLLGFEDAGIREKRFKDAKGLKDKREGIIKERQEALKAVSEGVKKLNDASKREDIIALKEQALNTVSKLSGMSKEALSILPLDVLAVLSEKMYADVADAKLMKKNFKEYMQAAEQELSFNVCLDRVNKEKGISAKSSEAKREYGIFGLTNLIFVGRKDASGLDIRPESFRAYSAEQLNKLMVTIDAIRKQNAGVVEEAPLKKLRADYVTVLNMFTEKSEEEYEEIPTSVLRSLLDAALQNMTDRGKARKIVDDGVTQTKTKYLSGVPREELDELATKAAGRDLAAARDLRERCLISLRRVPDMISHEGELILLPALCLYELMNAKLDAAPEKDIDEKAYLEELKKLEKEETKAKNEQEAIEKQQLDITMVFAQEKLKLKTEFEEYKIANSKKSFFTRDGESTVKEKEEKVEKKIEELSAKAAELLTPLVPVLEKAKRNVSRTSNKVLIFKEEHELLAKEKGQSAVLKKLEEIKSNGLITEIDGYGSLKKEKIKYVLNPDGVTAKIIKEEVEPAWTKEESATLNLIADLMSGDDVYDENGEEVKTEERVRTVLLRNVEALCELAEARKSEKESDNKWGGSLGGLQNKVNQEQIKVLSAVKDGVLNGLLDKLNELAGKAKLSPAKVKTLLQGEVIGKYLATSDAKFTAAIGKSEKLVEQMLEIATEDLFRGVTDESLDEIFANPLLHDVEEKEEEKNENKIEEDKSANKNKNKIEEESEEKRAEREKEEAKKAKAAEAKEKLMKLKDAVYDTEKGQGKFLRSVMSGYYKASTASEKRFMMSYMIRDMKPMQKNLSARQKGADYFASMLKGAGPLMQKLFQGIPEQMLMKEFQGALKVVKSELRPLPKEYVDAKLRKIAASTKGQVKSITKKQSLGAASIAETFLCDVVYKDGQQEQVVVKLLRPDALKRLESEKKFIEKCAEETDDNGVMKASFKAHLLKIEEEFNLKNEAKNCHSGRRYNVKDDKTGAKVSSVHTNTKIPAGDDYMVMNKAEGQTADRYMDDVNKLLDGCFDQFFNYSERTGSDYNANSENIEQLMKTTAQIEKKLFEAEKMQKHMEKLAWIWVEKALFENLVTGSNFHHGDLHAGNIMLSEEGATVLDYGNATKLPVAKVRKIVRMMSAVLAGFSGDFIKALGELIALDKGNAYNTLSDAQKKKMNDELKVKLDEIFKLGTPEQTGEKIFVALLKAQEVGYHLPQEIQNFSQCEQRLENSVVEFNETVNKLRAAYKKAICMPVNMGAKSIYDPMLFFQQMNHMDGGAFEIEYNTHKTMERFGVLDENEFVQLLKESQKDEKKKRFFYRRYMMELKNGYESYNQDDELKNSPAALKEIRRKYKRLMEMRKQLRDMGIPANEVSKVEDKAFKKEYYQIAGAESELLLLVNQFTASGIVNELYGGDNLCMMINRAFTNENELYFEEVMDVLENKVPKYLSIYEKYAALGKASKKEKAAAEQDFIKTYMDFQNETAYMNPNFTVLRHTIFSQDVYSKDFREGTIEQAKAKYPELKERIEKRRAEFKKQTRRYFNDKTKLGAQFRESYEEVIKLQDECIEKKVSGAKDYIETLKKRKGVEIKFINAYRSMIGKEFKKVHEMTRHNHTYELNDFLYIMGERMLANKKNVTAILNKDLGRYMDAFKEMAEEDE